MKNSLQDQLLQLGLVNKSKAQQVKKEQRKQAKISSNVTRELATKIAAEKAAKDRELNRQKELKQAAKARKALLKQFIEKNRLNDPQADQSYNFVHGTSVKRIYITEPQKNNLIMGKLAIVHWQNNYILVELKVADKIRELAKDLFVYIAPTQEQTSKDEYYTNFQVPDDLMW
ncbi:hypothetical protein TI03_00060 [Achromatium sp. WMS1]|nr:hypothetical protein TI03_00060 [Achromatium sp. WMS1]